MEEKQLQNALYRDGNRYKIGEDMLFTKGFLTFLLYYFGAVSLVALVLYMLDKIKAMGGAWRVPEKTLLLCSFFGGAVGGYVAMFLARHKIRKWYFHAVNILGLLWQLGLLLYISWKVLL